MISAAAMRAMAAAGATIDMIIAAVQADEIATSAAQAGEAERRREAGRIRQRRHRQRKGTNGGSFPHVADVTRDMRDVMGDVRESDLSARNSENIEPVTDVTRDISDKERSPPTPPSKENTHTGGARARDASISQDAHEAADAFLRAIGLDRTAPELHGMSGAPWSVAAWMRGGWTAEQIAAESARIAGERRDRGQDLPGLKYWNRVFSKPPLPQPDLLMRAINGGNDADNRGHRYRSGAGQYAGKGFSAIAAQKARERAERMGPGS
jgi:hypothetical protein